jgi:hypothetical protein
MTAPKQNTVAEWTAELDHGGRVHFRPLRRKVAVGLAYWPVVTALAASVAVGTVREGGPWGFWEYLAGLVAVGGLPLLTRDVWRFITRRPVITVDRQGVSRGWQRLTWSQIKQVELDHDDDIVIRPDHESDAAKVTVPDTYVDHPAAFADWLRRNLNPDP